MIVYELACAQEHRFEGWFASADDYAQQRERSLVRCPMCDDAAIERRPWANVQVGRALVPSPEHPVEVPADATSAVQARVLKLLRKMVDDSDDVGAAFPEEARKIHYDEAPPRSIRGQATPEESDALREEGIDFMSLPSFLTRDLQ
jgi:hypothetical protein